LTLVSLSAEVHGVPELFIPIVPKLDTFPIKERHWPVGVSSFALKKLRYFLTQLLKEALYIRI
jgi:hypothetical protein